MHLFILRNREKYKSRKVIKKERKEEKEERKKKTETTKKRGFGRKDAQMKSTQDEQIIPKEFQPQKSGNESVLKSAKAGSLKPAKATMNEELVENSVEDDIFAEVSALPHTRDSNQAKMFFYDEPCTRIGFNIKYIWLHS